MKNMDKFLAVIGIVTVFAFSMVGCSNDGGDTTTTTKYGQPPTNGRLTITGLDEYNNNFAAAISFRTPPYMSTLEARSNDWEYAEISNGQVTLCVWVTYDYYILTDFLAYSASETRTFAVFIESTATPGVAYGKGDVTVTFTNGVGTGAFVKETTP